MDYSAVRKIVVTGAGGRIAYALLFRLAAGHLFGSTQNVVLILRDLPEMAD